MSKRLLRGLLWLVAIPVAALVLGHLAFWGLADAIVKDHQDEGTALLLTVIGMASIVVATIGLLAHRAGKHPYTALGWGLAGAASTGVIYVLFAIVFFATCDCTIG